MELHGPPGVAGTQVAGLFRGPGAGSSEEEAKPVAAWAGFSQSGPSPFSPQLPTGRTVQRGTGDPVTGPGEANPPQGFPSSLQKSIGPLGHCT